ncbi:hypothetical protein BJV78DRAFT_1155136 [Lactifluus subvellereus]|nr:hypothetical protein BJV78DRAFT_1155136 [Lactifluus subvellereus]
MACIFKARFFRVLPTVMATGVKLRRHQIRRGPENYAALNNPNSVNGIHSGELEGQYQSGEGQHAVWAVESESASRKSTAPGPYFLAGSADDTTPEDEFRAILTTSVVHCSGARQPSRSLYPHAGGPGVITAAHGHQQAPGRLLTASMDWSHTSRIAKLTLRPTGVASHQVMALLPLSCVPAAAPWKPRLQAHPSAPQLAFQFHGPAPPSIPTSSHGTLTKIWSRDLAQAAAPACGANSHCLGARVSLALERIVGVVRRKNFSDADASDFVFDTPEN